RGVTTTRHAGTLPADKLSFMAVTGDNIVLSSFKRAETDPSAFITRFWNSGHSASKAKLTFFRKPSGVFMSNLAEAKLEAITPGKDGSCRFRVGAKQIVTILFKLSGKSFA